MPDMTASLCVLLKYTNHRTTLAEGIRNIGNVFTLGT